ncbi:zinc-dependent alcohol dehydrogenase family protein [Sphingomonas colocasiae]|uniref:Zinc-dependent alcohol dehydrogenase family protein n=1 Tax=Sphingomonas colocasiae TaxID=1848973 RepID=A0ABS7PU85_9SPHN|nr:zinc-dependent alcohol dehydrogenase family protein [Sphingomonas colocasiae]MBY8824922.1 zinc-dependent alcohol dehydrogenase family protein [Sphingomonas colocasiae]
MAKVFRFHELGGPEVLRLEDIEIGDPGPGEVKLRIEAIGVNRGEAAMRGGHYIVAPPLPSRLGSEAAAIVEAVGPGVTQWQAGDRVSTLPAQPLERYSTYGEETLFPADRLVRRPDTLDAVQSAASWVAFLTAWGGLIEAGGLHAEQPVVITAASSSVGIAAIQIVRTAGAIPIATTRTADKAGALLAAGAIEVIATDEEDVVERIRALTGGNGASLIFDPVAGPLAEKLCEALADNGTLIIYGGLSKQPAVFPRHLMIRSNLAMRGFNFNPMLVDHARRERALAAITPYLADGSWRMPIAHQFALADMAEAHRALERNEHAGKIIVTV